MLIFVGLITSTGNVQKNFNVILVINGVIASFWRVIIKFRWHGQNLCRVWTTKLINTRKSEKKVYLTHILIQNMIWAGYIASIYSSWDIYLLHWIQHLLQWQCSCQNQFYSLNRVRLAGRSLCLQKHWIL